MPSSSCHLRSLFWLAQFSFLILAWALVLSAIAPAGAAQSAIDDVHVRTPLQDPAAEGKARDSSSPINPQPLKVDVNLVLVPVTVTDGTERLVLGLEKENFQVYENNHLQSVQHFSTTDAPVSVGIILDTSGSMASKIDRAREAVVEFLKTGNPQDEFFMISFADTPTNLVEFTTSLDEITNGLVFVRPRGTTALLDAIYLGISKMRGAKNTKRALLIISDGGDNHSRYTEKDVKRLVKESDVIIYAIGVYDRYFPTVEEQLGPELLSDIATATGGRSFAVDNPNDLPDVASKIGVELRNQYVLGYRPSEATNDGKWHKIKVKLLPPKGLPRLQVSAKQGYYARSNEHP